MPVYMVDRHLPGFTRQQYDAAKNAATEAIRQFAAQGKNVRYIRSMFLPEEARLMCLFEAPNAQLVKEVNDAAKLPYTRVIEAEDLTP